MGILKPLVTFLEHAPFSVLEKAEARVGDKVVGRKAQQRRFSMLSALYLLIGGSLWMGAETAVEAAQCLDFQARWSGEVCYGRKGCGNWKTTDSKYCSTDQRYINLKCYKPIRRPPREGEGQYYYYDYHRCDSRGDRSCWVPGYNYWLSHGDSRWERDDSKHGNWFFKCNNGSLRDDSYLECFDGYSKIHPGDPIRVNCVKPKQGCWIDTLGFTLGHGKSYTVYEEARKGTWHLKCNDGSLGDSYLSCDSNHFKINAGDADNVRCIRPQCRDVYRNLHDIGDKWSESINGGRKHYQCERSGNDARSRYRYTKCDDEYDPSGSECRIKKCGSHILYDEWEVPNFSGGRLKYECVLNRSLKAVKRVSYLKCYRGYVKDGEQCRKLKCGTKYVDDVWFESIDGGKQQIKCQLSDDWKRAYKKVIKPICENTHEPNGDVCSIKKCDGNHPLGSNWVDRITGGKNFVVFTKLV